VTRCRCSTPDLAPTAEGILYCRGCGERVADPRDELRDRALVQLTRRVRILEERLAELEPNGAGPNGARNGRTRNGSRPAQPALFDAEAAP
jgi:hypothetical protein